jgi:hypothetical protein
MSDAESTLAARRARESELQASRHGGEAALQACASATILMLDGVHR